MLCIVKYNYVYLKTHTICLLQSCRVETMRASVLLLVAFLALAFVVTYAADEVSVYVNSIRYFELHVVSWAMVDTKRTRFSH